MAGAVAVAGGVIGAVGNLYAGQSKANALDTSAQIQLQNAAEAEAQGQANATKQQIQAGHQIGQQEATITASGVSGTSTSALAMLGSSAANAEFDRLNILHNADVKSISYENEASMDKIGANSALTGGYISAFGSLLSGGGSNAAQSLFTGGGSTTSTDGTYTGQDFGPGSTGDAGGGGMFGH